MKIPGMRSGKDRKREWVEWFINRQRRIVVQRSREGEPWYIFDVRGGLKRGGVKTVGFDWRRDKAVEKAKVYIRGLRT